MPRRCTVCDHDEHHAINVALVQRDPYRNIAKQYGVSVGALSRHTQEHLPKLLVKAKDALEVAEADSLLDRIEALQSKTLATLEAVEEEGNYSVVLAAVREVRANLELIGRVTRELEAAPTLNIHLNSEWLELRAVIVGALDPHPAARESVLRAIAQANGGVR
jgi:hypothetical protein